jgi:phosphatidate cytidylyltransferase
LIRIVTALVLLPLFIGLVLFGNPFHFFLLVELVVVLCLVEYFSLLEIGEKRFRLVGVGLGILTVSSLVPLDHPWMVLSALLCTLFFPFFWSFGREMKNPARVHFSVMAGFGVLYVSVPLAVLALLRSMEWGDRLVLLICLSTWMGDTLAYWVGRSIGKTPFAPSISPKKTWEGTVGGLAGSLGLTTVLGLSTIPTFTGWDCLIIGLVIGALGTLGDLTESALKRGFGVKDSGFIVPGHGGMLDRIDSLLLSGPAAFLYIVLVVLPRS